MNEIAVMLLTLILATMLLGRDKRADASDVLHQRARPQNV